MIPELVVLKPTGTHWDNYTEYEVREITESYPRGAYRGYMREFHLGGETGETWWEVNCGGTHWTECETLTRALERIFEGQVSRG